MIQKPVFAEMTLQLFAIFLLFTGQETSFANKFYHLDIPLRIKMLFFSLLFSTPFLSFSR